MHPTTTAPMKIVVVGAGLGGLAAATCLAKKGHNVVVLESHNGLSEFGAGLQICPNATRLITVWGLRAEFEKRVLAPEASVARRYSTGEVVGRTPQNPDSEEMYGYPYWQIYRPDFQELLADGARKAGAQIQFGKKATEVDAEAGKVSLQDGTTVSGDVVICADGIHSRMRGCIPGDENATPVPFEEFNYRAMIPREAMMKDSETARLMLDQNTQAWLGPGRAIIAYPISRGKFFNVAVSVPRASDAPIGRWNQPADVSEFRSTFADFSPVVQKLVKLVESCAKWTIAELHPLKTWSSHSGKTILLGDAAHAMSPHAAQGSAMAIEDAAVLAECLSRFSTPEDLPAAAQAYQAIRRPRVEQVQRIARGNGAMWVLPDGPEQEARDKRVKAITESHDQELQKIGREGLRAKPKPQADMNAKWPEAAALMWLHGYDAITEAKEYLSKL